MMPLTAPISRRFLPPAAGLASSSSRPPVDEEAPFDRKAIALWTAFAVRVIRDKATARSLRQSARLIAPELVYPPGHGHERSPYRELIRSAKALDYADGLTRQRLIDLAYAVGRDLITHVGPDAADVIEELRLCLDRTGGVRAPRPSAYSQRVDIFDRDDDAEDTDTPYAHHAAMARFANAADEAEEIERALAGAAV